VNVLESVSQSEVIGGGKPRYQEKGSTCSDCDGSDWCHSSRHPTYVERSVEQRKGAPWWRHQPQRISFATVSFI
jgi:hypothetical protein